MGCTRNAAQKTRQPSLRYTLPPHTLMARLGVLTISGKSGTSYKFDAYPLNTVWPPTSAVYMLTHRHVLADGSAEHVCVHLGQVQNLQDLPASVGPTTNLRSANCICVLQEDDASRRKRIMEDITDAAAHPK